jgi:hypothetical protein
MKSKNNKPDLEVTGLEVTGLEVEDTGLKDADADASLKEDTSSKHEKKAFTLNNVNAITLINFYKIFKDLLNDLNSSFNDKVGSLIENNKDYQLIINYSLPQYKENMNADEYINSITLDSIDINFMTSLNNVYEYCKHTFAVRSIDILYQNEDIFLNKDNVKNSNRDDNVICTMFLPDIDFADLYYDDTSSQTKQTIWKYLQLLLFNIITSIDDISFFGNSLELLKIIDSENLSAKIQSTVEELSNIFSFKENKVPKKNNDDQECKEEEDDEDGEEGEYDSHGLGDLPNMEGLFNTMFNDLSNNFKEFSENMKNHHADADANHANDANDADAEHTNKNNKHNDYAIPDKEELFSHLNNLINGKIGSLAKEIAEETSKDFDLDSENLGDVNDLLKGFMKNPSKMMGLIDNINKKINNKMKDGSIKESELLEEATEIFKNMKNMPGMTNFNDILKSMNLDKFMPKGGKINPNTFQNMMEQNVKMSKMKERMRKKAENNKDCAAQDPQKNAAQDAAQNAAQNAAYTKNANDLQDLTANLSSLMEEMKSNTSFIEDIIKNQGNSNSTASTPRSNDEHSKRSTNNKKKAHRKKN